MPTFAEVHKKKRAPWNKGCPGGASRPISMDEQRRTDQRRRAAAEKAAIRDYAGIIGLDEVQRVFREVFGP